MSTEVTTPEQTVSTPQAPSITDEKLSFSDYERLRRGESLPVVEAPKSAPEANTAPEQKESSEESDTSEKEESESDTSEDESSQQSEDEPKDEVGQEKPKKKGGFQRRIDKLNARYTQAAQELEYWKQQALKGAGAPKTDAPQVDTASKPAAADGKPMPDNFETHAEYVEAIADWKAEQKLKERDQREAKSRLEIEQAKVVQTYAEKAKAFAAKKEDFSDVLSEVDDIPLSPAVREIILQSENGPELAYELAQSREEYARVCALPPLAAAREMGKLEARIAARASTDPKPETKKLTQAPKPIEPVGAAKSAPTSKSPEEMSFAEYERYRRDQQKRKRG